MGIKRYVRTALAALAICTIAIQAFGQDVKHHNWDKPLFTHAKPRTEAEFLSQIAEVNALLPNKLQAGNPNEWRLVMATSNILDGFARIFSEDKAFHTLKIARPLMKIFIKFNVATNRAFIPDYLSSEGEKSMVSVPIGTRPEKVTALLEVMNCQAGVHNMQCILERDAPSYKATTIDVLRTIEKNSLRVDTASLDRLKESVWDLSSLTTPVRKA